MYNELDSNFSEEISFLRDLVSDLSLNPDRDQLEQFFIAAILGPGDPYTGNHPLYGHIIFRLTDLVDVGMRNEIRAYVCDEGSISEPNIMWRSLEEWRREYLLMYSDIPALAELWPDAPKFLPLFQNSHE